MKKAKRKKTGAAVAPKGAPPTFVDYSFDPNTFTLVSPPPVD